MPAPIVALRGTDDRLVSRAATEEWKNATFATFELVELPGGHMYLVDAGEAITEQIGLRLSDREATSAAPSADEGTAKKV